LLQGKELGRDAHIDEIFQQTHLRKGTDQFVDERSQRTHVSKHFNFIIKKL